MHDIEVKIKENIKKIKEKIKERCIKCGRAPEEITIIGVTKTVDVETAKILLENGINNLGENRVQEFLKKYEEIGKNAIWHLIGHLQSNKIKYIVGKTYLIHSIDSFELLKKINEKSKEKNLITDVLIEVNMSGEETKYGLKEENEILKLFEGSINLLNIRICGLMTMAPFTNNEKEIRIPFQKTYKLFEKIKEKFNLKNFKYLSYGMSNDYLIAIEEGANILRIGTAFFN
ncbi:MAG TPA: YggS family pyridoxal phosphate-dependent enzyme [bacterium]|nr:YggS family pyridoxal phosphate-dependent enzyme [bacterium]HOL47279.1 YggS family pyridoxal phosphate-dependent enzyme [bacterium]HPQ18693.1 YggS family pyridoxal phosphate-dependent enzyme [bacterium]